MISNPLIELITSIIGMYAMILIARLNLAWTKAGLSNPIIVTIFRATQPIIAPIKKLARNYGRFETATFLLLIFFALLTAGLKVKFNLPITQTFISATKVLIDWTYYFYLVAIIISAVMSWIVTDPYHPLYMTLQRITDPICAPIRKAMLRVTGNIGIDFSPIIVILLLGFLRGILTNLLRNLT